MPNLMAASNEKAELTVKNEDGPPAPKGLLGEEYHMKIATAVAGSGTPKL